MKVLPHRPHPIEKNIFQKFENLTKIIWKCQKHIHTFAPLMKINLKITQSGQITFNDKVIALIIPKKGPIFNSKELSDNECTTPSPKEKQWLKTKI